LNLDFLVEQGGLVVASNELCAQDVPLSQDEFVLIFLVLAFGFELFDVGVEFGDFVVEVLYDFAFGVHFLLLLFEFATVFQQCLVLLFVLEVLLGEGHFLGLDFLLELVDLVVDYFVASLGLGDLVFGLGKVLAVGVAVGTH
jgi:hypothetical protein